MSSLVRRIQLRKLRSMKLHPARKHGNKLKGTPYRNCKVTRDDKGNIISWVRYH